MTVCLRDEPFWITSERALGSSATNTTAQFEKAAALLVDLATEQLALKKQVNQTNQRY